VIYKWNGSSFAAVQSIATSGTQGWESFTINGEQYLVVANQNNGSTFNINSVIYKWNGSSFAAVQNIATNGAVGWESFTLNGEQYLAVANIYNGSTHSINSPLYHFNTATGQFDLATQVTLDLGTNEDTPQTVTAAQLLANDGTAVSITSVSATAVDSVGTVYGTVVLNGSTITFTPNATADALAEGAIKDIYFSYVNDLGVNHIVAVRLGGLDNDPAAGAATISGAGHSYDLTAAGTQTLMLTADMIIGGSVTQNEPANAGDAEKQGMGGYNEFTTNTNWVNGSYALGATPNLNQVVVNGTWEDILDLSNDSGIWSLMGDVSKDGNTYNVYNHNGSTAQILIDSEITNVIL